MEVSTKSKMGKKSRSSGKRFEILVREDLMEKGYTVAKWTNTIKDGKIVAAKSKFNPYLGRVMSEGSGLPDFIALKIGDEMINSNLISFKSVNSYEVIGVESKMSKYLDKAEKEMTEWLLKNKIFSRFFVAYKSGRGKIGYIEYIYTENNGLEQIEIDELNM